MKKKIGYLNLDSCDIRWLQEHLPEGMMRTELLNLFSGAYASLVVEAQCQKPVRTAYLLESGDLCIDVRKRRVFRSGEEIFLTPKEFDILLFLSENRGTVFTREEIYRSVWSDDYIMDDSNIMAFIRKLRRKIEPDPDAPKYILTIWGVGYQFNDQL